MTKTSLRTTTHTIPDDDDAFENGILRDGRTARIKMSLRDADTIAGQIDAANHTHDGRHSELGLNRPGPRINDALDRSKTARAFEATVRDQSEAWRRGPSSVQSLDGMPPVERPSAPSFDWGGTDAAHAEAIKQRAYDEMCRAQEHGWKNLGQS